MMGDILYVVYRNTFLGRYPGYYCAAACADQQTANRVKDFLNRQITERPDGDMYGESAAHTKYSFGTNCHDHGDFEIAELPIFNESDVPSFFNANFLQYKEREEYMLEAAKKAAEERRKEEEKERQLQLKANAALKDAELKAKNDLEELQKESIEETFKKLNLESKEGLEDIEEEI